MRSATAILEQLDDEMIRLGKGQTNPETVNALSNAAGKMTSLMAVGQKYASATKRRPTIKPLDCFCTPKTQVVPVEELDKTGS